ncbi:hypothetical protein B0T20DRAFT_392364 [Sordaria brevicollis]|uniref:Uncharacterized protein n=1 Tax=Sordaria brevicollis TaxID=83679 RepID=A0AAE0UD41_SORBR|nr:hypothetical protein B0T20DRAFT_392364 [Sordaria brevicollis]
MTDQRGSEGNSETPAVTAGQQPWQFFSNSSPDDAESKPPRYTRRPSIRETRIGFSRDAWENPPRYSPPDPTTSDQTQNQQERDAALTNSQAPMGSSPAQGTRRLLVRDSRSTIQSRPRAGSPGIPPPPYTSQRRSAPNTRRLSTRRSRPTRQAPAQSGLPDIPPPPQTSPPLPAPGTETQSTQSTTQATESRDLTARIFLPWGLIWGV